jgi:hypothetical protein
MRRRMHRVWLSSSRIVGTGVMGRNGRDRGVEREEDEWQASIVGPSR